MIKMLSEGFVIFDKVLSRHKYLYSVTVFAKQNSWKANFVKNKRQEKHYSDQSFRFRSEKNLKFKKR